MNHDPINDELVTIQIAPSGKQFVRNAAQSPEMCNIADRYGCNGYRDDYRDVCCYTVGMDGYWFFNDLETAKKYITEALPVLQRDMSDEYRSIDEHEQWMENFAVEQACIVKKNDAIWAKKYPHGKRIPVCAWGGDFDVPKYAIKKSWDESDSAVAVAAICRKNKMVMGSVLCPRGQTLTNGKVDSSHYTFSMGKSCRAGGTNIHYQVWIAV